MCRHQKQKPYFGLWQKKSKSMVDNNFMTYFWIWIIIVIEIWKLFTQHQSTHNVVEVQNVTKERFGNLYQSRDRTKRTLECKGKAFLLFIYSLVLNHIIWNNMISYNFGTIISSAYLIILIRMLMIIELIS